MNIMIVGEASWNVKNSFGNTVSNLFCGEEWKDDHFSCFYTRKQLPDNEAEVDYYNLSAIDIIKGALHFDIKGIRFSSHEIKDSNDSSSHSEEQKLIDKIHRGKNEIVYFFHELIWRSKIWVNKDFKQFVEDCKPEILFSFCTSPFLLFPIIKYLKEETDCKVVLFIVDDVYSQYDNYSTIRKLYSKRDLKKCVSLTDRMYGISSEICHLYQNMFNKDVQLLMKGCNLSIMPKGYLNSPIRIIYAGNLQLGREEILSKLANTLEHINRNGVKAVMEIYTNATITLELSKRLNKGISSKIIGSRPYDEITQAMHNADVCLHVESFDEENKTLVRYSFSTKITDCLQSGNQLLAIGPSGIASIEYCKKIPGAIVIDNLEKIDEIVAKMIESEISINENRRLIRQFAEEHHNLSNIQQKLHNDLHNLIERK